MKKRISVILTIVLLASANIFAGCAKVPGAGQAGPDEPKRIVVAKVNYVPITMDMLIRMMNRIAPRNHGSQTQEQIEGVKGAALERLILYELAYQKAKSTGIAVDPQRVDDAVGDFKANLGGEEAFRGFLVRQNTTEAEFRAQIERGIVLEEIFAKEVSEKVSLPEDDIRSEYEREKTRYISSERLRVTDVVIFIKNNDEVAARIKARELMKKIRSDKNKNPWNLVLDGTFLVRNMDFQKLREKDRYPKLYEEAKGLRPGRLSKIFKEGDEYHIIKLIEYTPERQMTFDEARGLIEGKFRAQAEQKRVLEWAAELKKDAVIEIMDTDGKKDPTKE